MSPPVRLPRDQNLFLPDVIDFNMRNNPDQPFYVFAGDGGSIKTITHLEFGRAAHRVAHALRPNRSGLDGDVVGILAETDTILYNVVIAGLIVAGFVPFPISPRNTASSVACMLEKVACHRLLINNSLLPFVIAAVNTSLSDCYEVLIEEIPSISIVYPRLAYEAAAHPFQRYPDPPRRLSATDICMILHSCGSTGSPRAIPLTHRYWIQSRLSSELSDHVSPLVISSMSLPVYHAAGINLQLFTAVYDVVANAVFPPQDMTTPIVSSPETSLEHAMLTKSNAIFVIPSFIQAWVALPDSLAYLKSLEFLCYDGGTLLPETGEYLVNAGVRIHTIYGGTEIGFPTCLTPVAGDETNWEYVRFYQHTSIRWVPRGSNTFECQFLATEVYEPAVLNLADTKGYATGDIFRPHPTKKDLWKIIKCLDNVIVHESSGTTILSPVEVVITTHPLVQNAIVFCRRHSQTGVLIELRVPPEVKHMTDPSKLALLRTQIWPMIEDANAQAPTSSRIYQEMILFTSQDKPVPYAIDGTILRRAALELYDSEISALYENRNMSIDTEVSCPVSWDVTDVQNWIMQQASEITSKKYFSPDLDVFQQGFDSLSASTLRLRIINAMRMSGNSSLEMLSPNVKQDLVSSIPTIKGISNYIVALQLRKFESDERVSTIERLIMKYGGDFHPSLPGNSASPSSQTSGLVVLLTGSTGQLGSQILARLLENNHIGKVYALNRGGGDLQTRHIGRFEDIGLDLDLLGSSKLVMLCGDSTRCDLGLDKQLYEEISFSIDILIHNAWQVDFNMSLPSFEWAIKSSRNLIDLIRQSPNVFRARFVFISTVASIQSWDDSCGPVPEDIPENISYALGSGYGEAKYIVERLLKKSGLHATSLRFGQICGGHPKGSWPITDWLPMLVRSSVTLGMIPDLEGNAAWLPGDLAAAAVVDVALSVSETPLPSIFNIIHPFPVDHKIIISNIVSEIREILGLELQVVPVEYWISRFEEHAKRAAAESFVTTPVMRIIAFLHRYAAWKSSPRTFSLQNIQKLSLTMHPAHMNSINDNDVKWWVKYWHGHGYLS
ncbi:L-aminoadipate-semialdehyde dehydrogenase [Termitomyces sp. T112]|nr:L-aminoadipate-semialdehyde dehydrogenase [Termitomyces sp. T112]